MGVSQRTRLAGVAATCVACALSLVLLVGPAASGEDDRLRPDLVVERPTEIYLGTSGPDLRLRTSNTIANVGRGPLEMFPQPSAGGDCDGDGDVRDDRFTYQRVFRDADPGDGAFDRSVDTEGEELTAGCSRFHPAHNHWHFEGFARYRLIRESTGRVLALARKVSFCIIDTGHPYPDLPGSPNSRYYPQDPGAHDPEFATCSQTSVDGLSVGWEDTYGASLQGQGVRIGGIGGGYFCLELTADPGDRIDELEDANNTRSVRLRIRPSRESVRTLRGSCRAPSRA